MNPTLTDLLCTTCGLCCDGSLFADVELAGIGESSTLEVLGLEVEEPDAGHRGLLVQPCRALRGTRCGIYGHRPNCCRTFECRLLRDTLTGTVDVVHAQATVADARGRIANVTGLVDSLGSIDRSLPLRERCAEALTVSALDADQGVHRRRHELDLAMTTLEAMLQATFLRD